MALFLRLVVRELRLAFANGAEAAIAVMFFVFGAALFPFGIGPEPDMLARTATGVIWVMALFAALLSLERLYAADFEDGSLDQLALVPAPLEVVTLAKALAHWLTTGVPLMVAAPVAGVLLHLPGPGFVPLIAAMALATPTLSLIGGMGAALTLGARRGGVLVALLVLPLLVPVLIFAAAAVEAALLGMNNGPPLAALAGFLIGALVLCPWGAAAALRQALQ